jgi:hypothetical protein
MIGLTLVEKPFETYLVIRDADGDRELNGTECRELIKAAARIEALEAALREVIVTMRHAHIFIISREQMHPTGVKLYDELLDKLAVLAHAERLL